MTFTERLNNEYKRLNTFFRIENGRGFYVENGYPYTRKEFEDKYPTPLRVSSDPMYGNSDKTKDWMTG